MKRKFLLLVMMCLLGGLSSSLLAQETVTIGTTGTSTNAYYPFRTQRAYGHSQQIYTNSELSDMGNNYITHITYFTTTAQSKTLNNVSVYMQNTDKASFTGKSDWVKSGFTLVYSGSVYIDGATTKEMVIKLDDPFYYEKGKNLIVYVDLDNNTNTAVAWYWKTFQVVGGNTNLTYYNSASDGYGDDGNTWTSASGAYNTRNQIKFTYTDKIDTTIDKPEFFNPEDYSWYYTPQNNAKDILTTPFMFTAKYTTDYQIILSTASDLSNPRYIAGGESTWAKVTDEQINEGIVCVQTDVISDLESDKDYYWQVKAMNVSGNMKSDVVESAIFTFTTAAAAKPEQLGSYSPASETVCYDGYPTLTWEYGANSAQYQLLLGDTENLTEKNHLKVSWSTAGILGDSYPTSGLAVGTYYWQVNVKNGNYITEGEVYSFTIPEVENISNATADVNNNVLSWTFAKGTSQYKVLLGRATTENPEHPYEFLTEHQTDWMDVTNENGTFTLPTDNIVAGATYYWAVDVKNYADQKIYFNMIKDRTPIKNENGVIIGWEPAVYEHQVEVYSFVTSDMAAAENYSPKDNTLNLENPELKWNFNGNAAVEYKVFLGTDATDLKAVTEEWLKRETVATGLAGQASYQTENLTPATKYFWRVDVRDANENVAEGKVWSFGTTLPITTVEAVPSEIFPTVGVYGGTNINWDLVGAQRYNVYLDNLGDDKDAEIIKTTNSNVYTHAILATDTKLQYNMEEGYNIYVEADFGELGKSMSEAVNVKVSGKSEVSGKVFSNNTKLADATVTLILKIDEFGNEIVDATKYTYTYKTNSNGEMFETQNTNGNISQVTKFQFHNGIYEVTVEAEYHKPYTGELTIKHNGGNDNNLSVTLTPDQTVIFNVTLYNVTFNSVDIYLENSNWEEAQPGYYHVYLKNGDKTEDLKQQYFGVHNDYATSVKLTYSDWATLGKGNYQFGVAKAEGKVNWSAVQSINYDILDGAGEWTEAANWRDGKLPEENAEVCIIADVTIAEGKAVTVKNVNIKSGGSLTINGSLTANEVVNEAGNDALVINEGGQLRQNNTNLNGKFVMTVTPPTSWEESNTDGWQFIASPVEGVEFSKFVPANVDGQGDYDLYQYDGKNNKWRNHKHKYGEDEEAFEFGDKFVVGTAYLAALQYERDVTFSGTLNAAQTHTFNVSHNAEKNAANYHLLGNPFTFAMDVEHLKPSGLATGYAVLNEAGNDYTYITTGQIPVGDGFFVMATEATAALTYSETRGAAEETANINIVAKGAAGSNNVIINMAGDKEGFRKLEGFNKEIANIYVENKGNKYAIYNCESDVNEVELTFVAKQMGSYSLSFDINGEFETVTLVDRMTGVETDMIAEGEYNFIATSNDMKNRFAVRLSNSMTSTEEFLANFVYQSGEELIINAEGTIQIIDMMGRVVYSNENANGNDRISVSEFNNAAYVVRVINGNGVKSQKVVIY